MSQMSKIHIKELGHIVLYVRNLSSSVDFYQKVLGWKRIPTPPNQPIAAFSGGKTHHELLLIEVGNMAEPKPPHLQLGVYHFGLKIGDSDSELKQAILQLKTYGITITGSADHHVTHSLYIKDPDGNEIELYIDVDGVDWKKDGSLITRPAEPLVLD